MNGVVGGRNVFLEVLGEWLVCLGPARNNRRGQCATLPPTALLSSSQHCCCIPVPRLVRHHRTTGGPMLPLSWCHMNWRSIVFVVELVQSTSLLQISERPGRTHFQAVQTLLRASVRSLCSFFYMYLGRLANDAEEGTNMQDILNFFPRVFDCSNFVRHALSLSRRARAAIEQSETRAEEALLRGGEQLFVIQSCPLKGISLSLTF